MFKQLSVLSLLLAGSAFANQPYRGPILSKAIGGLGNDGVVTKCDIYGSHAKAAGAIKKIRAASKEKINTAMHVRAQVPSEEYYAYLPEQTAQGLPRLTKVLLMVDYSDMKTREGADADELIQLIY